MSVTNPLIPRIINRVFHGRFGSSWLLAMAFVASLSKNRLNDKFSNGESIGFE
jgi:hypothetical protein